MRSRRRAKKHEHVSHERWLVSYADFITLLFAFFVVMFAVSQVDSKKVGRFVESGVRDPELIQEAEAAFQALVDALVAQQREGLVRRDDPILLARFVWSVVHGIAMLTIDGQLHQGADSAGVLHRYVTQRIQAAIATVNAAQDGAF